MSDQTTPAPRAINEIVADLTKATEAFEKASNKDAKDKAKAQVDALNAEHREARIARYAAYEAELRRQYDAADGAGQKAAIRRRMNKVREAQGLGPLVAGTRSTASSVPADVAAMLAQDGITL